MGEFGGKTHHAKVLILRLADSDNVSLCSYTHTPKHTHTHTSGSIVFFMQAGFSMLEVGAIRSKNTINILYKNILDAAVAALGFWFIGYMFAYGSSAGGFIGIDGGYISISI